MSLQQAVKIRLLLVDDHELFREGVARLLGAEPDFELVAHCASVDEALKFLGGEPPDVVLLDYDLGAEHGTRFLHHARERGYGGRVLIVTAGLTDREATELLALGAAGIFHKHSSPSMLAKAIRKVTVGEAWVDQRYLKLVLSGEHSEERSSDSRLTEREREVLRGVFAGLANKEIAARLQVSESSVKASLQQLFNKAGVHTRSQLVRIALERYRDEL